MTSAISGSFVSAFGVSGQLGVGTVSILGGDATSTTPSAATVLTAANATANNGALSVLGSQTVSAGQQATLAALGQGALTPTQHNVITAIATATDGQYTFDWNADGSEPSVVATMRKYGWIKLLKPNYSIAGHETVSGLYELTAIGKKIYTRTAGSSVASSSPAAGANSAATASSSAAPSGNTVDITA